MQRLYSTFPAGRPGVGLLLLRIAIGATMILEGSAYLAEYHGSSVAIWAASLVTIVGGAALLIGLLTPLIATLATVGSIGVAFSWFPAPTHTLFNGNPLSFDVVLMAAACAFLGPGAFSLDAHLFGRRKIIIPQSSRTSNPVAP